MGKKYRGWEYVILVAVIITGLVFFAGREKRDIGFCRSLFYGLTAGRLSVAKLIDWQNFKGLGADVGEIYGKLPNERQREIYKKAFIKGFSQGSKKAGGAPRAFINWRIYTKEPDKVVIAADYPRHKKTLLFTLSKGKERKLVALEWQEMK